MRRQMNPKVLLNTWDKSMNYKTVGKSSSNNRFAEWFSNILDTHKIDRSRLVELGIHNGCITHWLNNARTPSIMSVNKLCKALETCTGISMDDLIVEALKSIRDESLTGK